MNGRNRINLRQLTYLRKAIELGNITRAAKELHVAQTALGFQIRSLEEELGVPLLDRHSRGVTATAAGEILNRYTTEISTLLVEAKQAVLSHAAQSQVQVQMGVTPSIMRLVGDDILITLSQTLPNISLGLVEELSFVLMQLLERDEITCALTFSPKVSESYQRIALLEEELCYLPAHTDGPDPAPTIKFVDALRSDLVFTSRQDAVFQLVENIARRLGQQLSVAYEVQSIRAVKNLVSKGIASTIMPYGAAEGELRSGALRAQLIVSPSVIRTLNFVYHQKHSAVVESAAFRAFIMAIAGRLHEHEPGPITRLLYSEAEGLGAR